MNKFSTYCHKTAHVCIYTHSYTHMHIHMYLHTAVWKYIKIIYIYKIFYIFYILYLFSSIYRKGMKREKTAINVLFFLKHIDF